MDYARQVSRVDPAGLPAPAVPDAATPLRPDVVTPSLDRQEVLDAAPLADKLTGLFKVPRVLG